MSKTTGYALRLHRSGRGARSRALFTAETERASSDVWPIFQRQHAQRLGKTLSKADEPNPLKASEFTWDWSRAGEPAGLSECDFVEDRLHRLIRMALERKIISLGRAAEILRISREDMRKRAADWAA